MDDTLQHHIITSLSYEYNNLLSSFRNSITKGSKQNHEKSYRFGKELILLDTQIYKCTNTLTHLLKVSLFGNNFSLLEDHEVVHRTKNEAVIHIASYARLLQLFTKGGKSWVLHFRSPDDYEVVFACCSKVWLKKDGKECIGYVLDEADDEIEVMIEHSNDRIMLTRPSYSARDGRYSISEAKSTHTHGYEFENYWHFRMKLSNKGNIAYILNRVKFEYDNYNYDDLFDQRILIQSKHICKVITPIY